MSCLRENILILKAAYLFIARLLVDMGPTWRMSNDCKRNNRVSATQPFTAHHMMSLSLLTGNSHSLSEEEIDE
ncbi:hypothetical protein ACLKA6_014659 [Drosophila palustris]